MSLVRKVKLLHRKLVGPLEESKLIGLVEQGDHQAFETLYYAYKKPLYNFLLHFMRGDQAVANELLQETFLKVFQRSSQFRAGSNFSSWVWAIARNTALDYLKRKDALNFKATLTDSNGEVQNVEELSLEITDAEEILLRESNQLRVRQCLSKLKGRQQDAVHLRMFSELSYDEIAAIMQTTVSSVKSLLNRAKKSLTLCLKGESSG